MLAQPADPSKHQQYIDLLAELYDISKFYSDDIYEDEVTKPNRDASRFGGFSDCWEGFFLGRHKVALKAPQAHLPVEVIERVCRPFPVLYLND